MDWVIATAIFCFFVFLFAVLHHVWKERKDRKKAELSYELKLERLFSAYRILANLLYHKVSDEQEKGRPLAIFEFCCTFCDVPRTTRVLTRCKQCQVFKSKTPKFDYDNYYADYQRYDGMLHHLTGIAAVEIFGDTLVRLEEVERQVKKLRGE